MYYINKSKAESLEAKELEVVHGVTVVDGISNTPVCATRRTVRILYTLIGLALTLTPGVTMRDLSCEDARASRREHGRTRCAMLKQSLQCYCGASSTLPTQARLARRRCAAPATDVHAAPAFCAT